MGHRELTRAQRARNPPHFLKNKKLIERNVDLETESFHDTEKSSNSHSELYKVNSTETTPKTGVVMNEVEQN